MIMETGLKLSFKQLGLQGLGLFFLLLSLQLHLLLALLQTDLNQEKEIGREPILVPKKLSIFSIKLGGKHEIKAVRRRGGAVGAHGGEGEHGNAGDAAGNNGGGTKSPDGQGGAVIPVYAAGAMNHNRYHHHHGSSSGTINCIGSSFLVLILLISFLFVYSI
ncbi:hypothetical protein CRYUN_Cryun02cG0168100 [Craigia yunnanensis]